MKQALEKGPAQRSSLRNKYLPLIAIVGLLLFSLCSHAQYDSTKLRQIVNAYGFDWKNGKFRGSFIVPTDTTKMAVKDSAAIAYSHGKFWGNNGYGWSPLGNGADLPTWQQTLSTTNGHVLTQDNIVNAKGYKFNIDSLKTFRIFNYATETVTDDPDYKIKNNFYLSDDINEGATLSSSFINSGSGSILYESSAIIGSYQVGLSAHDVDNNLYSTISASPDYITLQSDNYISISGDSAVYFPSIPDADSSRQLATTKWVKKNLKSYARNLTTNTTLVGNVGAGLDDLMTYTLPANTLGANGDYIEFYMHFYFASNVNTKEIILFLGGTDFYTTGDSPENGGSLLLKGTIVRTASNAQLITIEQLGSEGSGFATKSVYAIGSENLTTNLVIKATGSATSNDDVIQNLMTVKYFPGN